VANSFEFGTILTFTPLIFTLQAPFRHHKTNNIHPLKRRRTNECSTSYII